MVFQCRKSRKDLLRKVPKKFQKYSKRNLKNFQKNQHNQENKKTSVFFSKSIKIRNLFNKNMTISAYDIP